MECITKDYIRNKKYWFVKDRIILIFHLLLSVFVHFNSLLSVISQINLLFCCYWDPLAPLLQVRNLISHQPYRDWYMLYWHLFIVGDSRFCLVFQVIMLNKIWRITHISTFYTSIKSGNTINHWFPDLDCRVD